MSVPRGRLMETEKPMLFLSFPAFLFAGLAAMALAWSIGSRAAKNPVEAPLARAVAVACCLGVGFLYFGSSHRMPPEILMLGAIVYPLLACERGKALGRRAFVLSGLVVLTLGEALDLLAWRRGREFPDVVGSVMAALLLVGVPLAGIV